MREINNFLTKSSMLMVYLVITSFPCSAEIQGDKELLKTIALANKANFESILTWKSDVNEERKLTIGDSFQRILNSNCEMVYDQLEQAVRWNKTPQEYFIEENGKRKTDPTDNTTYYQSSMLKKSYYYNYEGNPQEDPNNRIYILNINDAKMSRSLSNYSFDPRLLLTLNGIPIYNRLMSIYDNANNPEGSVWYISRTENLITLELKNNNSIEDRYIFDISKGGNLVEWYNKANNVVNERKCTYENTSGSWILKTYYKTNTDTRREDIEITTRLLKWDNSVVNVPLKNGEFTIEEMGIKNGEEIQDHIAGMSYRYGIHSAALKVLDSIAVPQDITTSENTEESKDILQENIVKEHRISTNNEADNISKDTVLMASKPKSTYKYIHIIIITFIFGLTIVGYIVTRKVRNGKNSV